MLVLEFRVRARVMVKVRTRVRDSWGTKRLGYEMSGSPSSQCEIAIFGHLGAEAPKPLNRSS